jgi:hypothetical protein
MPHEFSGVGTATMQAAVVGDELIDACVRWYSAVLQHHSYARPQRIVGVGNVDAKHSHSSTVDATKTFAGLDR